MVHPVNLFSKSYFTFVCLLFSLLSFGEKPLEIKVDVKEQNIAVSSLLDVISINYDVSFSYSPDLVYADSIVTVEMHQTPIRQVLDHLFNKRVTYKTAGKYIVLLPSVPVKKEKKTKKTKEYITISGRIVDSRTGNELKNVSIYKVDDKYSTLSSSEGEYKLEIPANKEPIGVRYSKSNYIDTIIIIQSEPATIDLGLTPRVNLEKLPLRELKDNMITQSSSTEDHTIARILIPEDQFTYSNNFDYFDTRPGQFSVLPILGSNALMSGAVENTVSINLFGGYSGGVRGIELGAGFNIVKKDVTGVQLAGFGNLVGQNVTGVQAGGFANNVHGNVKGVQLGGFSNVVLDSLTGIQAAGFNNTVLGHIDGIQIAGFSNISLKHNNVQLSGFSNVSLGTLDGIQMAGFSNVSHSFSGAQMSGFLNISYKESKGLQVASILNYAQNHKGIQVGLINISDSLKGVPIGLFNYSKYGVHTWELSYNEYTSVNLTYRAGSNSFYNIYTAGFRHSSGREWFSTGLGIGTRIPISKVFYTNFSITGSTFSSISQFYYFNVLGRFTWDLEIKLLNRLSIFGGPSMNFLILDKLANDFSSPYQSIETKTSANLNHPNLVGFQWLGFSGGLRF